MPKNNFGTKLDRRINEIADEQAHEVGIALRKKVRELVPKDTGLLRQSIHMSARKREKSVYVFVDYSKTINKRNGFNYGKWIIEGEPKPWFDTKNRGHKMRFYYKGKWTATYHVESPTKFPVFQQAKQEVLAERRAKRGGKNG